MIVQVTCKGCQDTTKIEVTDEEWERSQQPRKEGDPEFRNLSQPVETDEEHTEEVMGLCPQCRAGMALLELIFASAGEFPSKADFLGEYTDE